MKIDTSVATRAGLIGAVAGLVVALLSRIPFLGCLVAPLGWVVALATGALYVHFRAERGGSVELAEGAVGGGVAGAVAGAVQSLVSGLLTLIFGAVDTASSLFGGSDIGGTALAAGVTIIGVVIGLVVGAIIGAVLGAIGGAIYSAIKK
jgi:uncharacterized protein YqgC (DUF456 family)